VAGRTLVIAGKPAGLGQRAFQSRSSWPYQGQDDHGGQAAPTPAFIQGSRAHSSRNDL